MNIPGMMGRGGMMGGAPQASSGDTPQVDTAENVQISSLALLKMLKHGTWRDRRRPRARLHRGSRVDDEPPAKSPNPRAGVSANARHGLALGRRPDRSRRAPEGVFEPFGCFALSVAAIFASRVFFHRRRPADPPTTSR
jgi:hypothetical protein